MKGVIAFTKDSHGWRCAGRWTHECRRSAAKVINEEGKKKLLLQGALHKLPRPGQFCHRPREFFAEVL